MKERRTLQKLKAWSRWSSAELDAWNHVAIRSIKVFMERIHLRDSLQQKIWCQPQKSQFTDYKVYLTQLQDTNKPKFPSKEITGSITILPSGEKYNVVIQSTLPIIPQKNVAWSGVGFSATILPVVGIL